MKQKKEYKRSINLFYSLIINKNLDGVTYSGNARDRRKTKRKYKRIIEGSKRMAQVASEVILAVQNNTILPLVAAVKEDILKSTGIPTVYLTTGKKAVEVEK